MKISDGTLEVSVAPFGEPGEFEVRVPKELGEDMRQELEAAGFDPGPKGEFSAIGDTIVWLVSSGTVALLIHRLTPALDNFWHRHDGKEVAITRQPGKHSTITYKGYPKDAVLEMESTLGAEVEYDMAARERLGMPAAAPKEDPENG